MKTTMSRYILPIITLLFINSAFSQTQTPQPTPRFTPTPIPGAIEEPKTQEQEANASKSELRYHTTPTPMLLVTGDNPTPTPTITSIPLPGFEECMRDCLRATYPNNEFPFNECFEAAVQAGILVACGLNCAPFGPAWSGCVGGCYAISLAACMGVGVFEMTAVATGCAWGCL